MSKEVRVCLSLIQIALMLLSVVSFSVIVNSGVVSGGGPINNVEKDSSANSLIDIFNNNCVNTDRDEKTCRDIINAISEQQSHLQQPTSTLGLHERLFRFNEGEKAGSIGDFTISGGTVIDAIASAFSYATVAYAAITTLGGALGLKESEVKKFSQAAAAAALLGKGTSNILQMMNKGEFLGGYAPWAVGLAAFAMTYKKQETKIVKFECKPWEPPCSLLKA